MIKSLFSGLKKLPALSRNGPQISVRADFFHFGACFGAGFSTAFGVGFGAEFGVDFRAFFSVGFGVGFTTRF